MDHRLGVRNHDLHLVAGSMKNRALSAIVTVAIYAAIIVVGTWEVLKNTVKIRQ